MVGIGFWIFVFGKRKGPEFGRLDDGVYSLGWGYPPYAVRAGDKALLYCTAKYPDDSDAIRYSKCVPAIGTVINATREAIDFEPVLLPEPLSRNFVNNMLDPEAKQRFRMCFFTRNNVIEITPECYGRILRES